MNADAFAIELLVSSGVADWVSFFSVLLMVLRLSIAVLISSSLSSVALLASCSVNSVCSDVIALVYVSSSRLELCGYKTSLLLTGRAGGGMTMMRGLSAGLSVCLGLLWFDVAPAMARLLLAETRESVVVDMLVTRVRW